MTAGNVPASGPFVSSPQKKTFRSSPPREAFSHSASVGRRLPAHLQNSLASNQLTLETACSSCPGAILPSGQCQGGFPPLASRNLAYSALVTSYLSMEK